jgi:hypothetical protein
MYMLENYPSPSRRFIKSSDFLATARNWMTTTITTSAEQIVNDQAKLVAEPNNDAKIGPRIDPNPKAPVLIAER